VEKLDLPVKRNQAFIVTYFSKTREKFCGHLLGDDKEGSSSSKLLGQGEARYSSLGETERKGSRAARKELLIKVETYLIAKNWIKKKPNLIDILVFYMFGPVYLLCWCSARFLALVDSQNIKS
jgi:hypothetical protein